MTNLKPCGSRLLVQPDPVDNEVNGIILPYETSDTIQSGTIVAAGPDATTLHEGQRVLFARRGPQRLTEGDNEYLTMLASEIWFVIGEPLVIKPTLLDDIYNKWGKVTDGTMYILFDTIEQLDSVEKHIQSGLNMIKFTEIRNCHAEPHSITTRGKTFVLKVCSDKTPPLSAYDWYKNLYK